MIEMLVSRTCIIVCLLAVAVLDPVSFVLLLVMIIAVVHDNVAWSLIVVVMAFSRNVHLLLCVGWLWVWKMRASLIIAKSRELWRI